MKNAWKWILGIVLVVLVLVALPFVWRVACPYCGGYGWYGMPMMGHGFGMTPFGMLFVWLVPLGVLFLLIFGIVWLVRNVGGSTPSSRTCGKCGKPAQPDWKDCPYCGHAL